MKVTTLQLISMDVIYLFRRHATAMCPVCFDDIPDRRNIYRNFEICGNRPVNRDEMSASDLYAR